MVSRGSVSRSDNDFHRRLVTDANLSAVRAAIPCAEEAEGVVPGVTVSLHRWAVAGEREPGFVLVYEDARRAVFRVAGRVEWGGIQVDRRDGGETSRAHRPSLSEDRASARPSTSEGRVSAPAAPSTPPIRHRWDSPTWPASPILSHASSNSSTRRPHDVGRGPGLSRPGARTARPLSHHACAVRCSPSAPAFRSGTERRLIALADATRPTGLTHRHRVLARAPTGPLPFSNTTWPWPALAGRGWNARRRDQSAGGRGFDAPGTPGRPGRSC